MKKIKKLKIKTVPLAHQSQVMGGVECDIQSPPYTGLSRCCGSCGGARCCWDWAA